MRRETAARRRASPRAASASPRPSLAHSTIVDDVWAGCTAEEMEHLCAFLLGEPTARLALPSPRAAASLQPASCGSASCWGRGYAVTAHPASRSTAAAGAPHRRPLRAVTQNCLLTSLPHTKLHPDHTPAADGDDGAPLQAHQSSTSQRPEPALSCAEAPPAPLHRQCSPPAAQPRTPFCAINPAPWPVHVSPFALDTCPAPVFTAPPPRSACGSPPLPERTGDSALSWVALWCARAEAEGIDCLPPPSLSSWQELVAVGSLSGSLSQR